MDRRAAGGPPVLRTDEGHLVRYNSRTAGPRRGLAIGPIDVSGGSGKGKIVVWDVDL